MGLLSNIYNGILNDPFILPFAVGSMVVHALLTVALGAIPAEGPWKPTKIFSAKQIISFVMMITQTILGIKYWCFHPDYDKDYTELVEDESNLYQDGVFMAKIVLGGLIYDIPAGFATGTVDTMMHFHHFGMFTVASIALGYAEGVPQYHRYAPFFFGVIEFSSIFLQIVELFNPRKHPEWHKYHTTVPVLQKLNEISRILFAVTYMIFRMVWFPKVMFQQVWPDSLLKWSNPENEPYKTPILVMLFFTIFFTGLQLYWGYLIIQQVLKMLQGGGDDKEEKDTSGKAKAKIKSV